MPADIYAAVSALPGAVAVAGLGDMTPDAARRLADALRLHANQAESLGAMDPRDARNAALGNRHSRLILAHA